MSREFPAAAVASLFRQTMRSGAAGSQFDPRKTTAKPPARRAHPDELAARHHTHRDTSPHARRQPPASIMTRARISMTTGPPSRRKLPTPIIPPEGYTSRTNSNSEDDREQSHDGAAASQVPSDPGKTGSGDVELDGPTPQDLLEFTECIWSIEWKLIPRKSWLTYGVGIQSLGYVMDALTDGHGATVKAQNWIRSLRDSVDLCLDPMVSGIGQR